MGNDALIVALLSEMAIATLLGVMLWKSRRFPTCPKMPESDRQKRVKPNRLVTPIKRGQRV